MCVCVCVCVQGPLSALGEEIRASVLQGNTLRS